MPRFVSDRYCMVHHCPAEGDEASDEWRWVATTFQTIANMDHGSVVDGP